MCASSGLLPVDFPAGKVLVCGVGHLLLSLLVHLSFHGFQLQAVNCIVLQI